MVADLSVKTTQELYKAILESNVANGYMNAEAKRIWEVLVLRTKGRCELELDFYESIAKKLEFFSLDELAPIEGKDLPRVSLMTDEEICQYLSQISKPLEYHVDFGDEPDFTEKWRRRFPSDGADIEKALKKYAREMGLAIAYLKELNRLPRNYEEYDLHLFFL